MSNFLDVKLVLVDYKPKKVKDLIPGLLALIRDKDEMFFVTEDIIKINKQLEDASGTFVLQDGAGVGEPPASVHTKFITVVDGLPFDAVNPVAWAVGALFNTVPLHATFTVVAPPPAFAVFSRL